MIASTPTLLSLYEWGHNMGISPWSLAQIGEGLPGSEDERFCQDVWNQYSWEGKFISREEIATTIAAAEEAIAHELGYWPAPVYTEQTVEHPRLYSRNAYGSGYMGSGQKNTISLNWKKIAGAGTITRTAIDAAVAVVMSDPDGDGLNDKFTLTVPTSVANPLEIAVYFNSTDRLGEPLSDVWRIRPVNVSISGGTATITGHAALLVLPSLQMTMNPQSLDATAAIYATEVSVYRRYLDMTATDEVPNQGYALWEAFPEYPCSETPCEQSTKAICVGERYADMGQVFIHFADSECISWRNPDRIRVKYVSGEPLQPNGKMPHVMMDIISKYATALLPLGSCGCDRSDKIIHWWRGMGNSDETERRGRLVTFNEIDSPFGERRGAVYAWKRVQRLKELGFGVIG